MLAFSAYAYPMRLVDETAALLVEETAALLVEETAALLVEETAALLVGGVALILDNQQSQGARTSKATLLNSTESGLLLRGAPGHSSVLHLVEAALGGVQGSSVVNSWYPTITTAQFGRSFRCNIGFQQLKLFCDQALT